MLNWWISDGIQICIQNKQCPCLSDWCHVYELGSSETFVRLLLRYIVRCQITFAEQTFHDTRFLPHISVRTCSKYILYKIYFSL